jgi:hypothetical protein
MFTSIGFRAFVPTQAVLLSLLLVLVLILGPGGPVI